MKRISTHSELERVTDEAQFRAIADAIPALVAIMTPTGGVESVNCHVLAYFGTTHDQLRHWPTSDSVHPDDLAAVVAAWSHAVETGEAYDIEHRMRRADGVYRWFHARALPTRDAQGQIARWCCLQTDIDDRKRAELVATGEKALLEMVVSGVALPIVLEALCRLLDTTADGCSSGVLLLDRSHTKVQHAIAPALPAEYNRAFEGTRVTLEQGPCGMAASLKRQIIVSDIAAETRWDSEAWPALALSHGLRSCWSSPVLSLSGDSLGTFAVYQRSPASPTPYHQALIQQLTHVASIAIERARSEEALKRSQAVLTEAQLLSATGSFSLDPTSGLHWWSEQTYRIFGFEPGQPRTLDDMRARAHPEDVEILNHALECAQRGEGFSVELRLQMPDGAIKYLQVEAHAVEIVAGGPSESVGAVRDVTERRRSEEALGKARSELAHVSRVSSLGILTASIAHEVNQPLSGIVTNASTGLRMLAAEPPNVDGARETTRRTIRDAQRASDVISRLRTLFGRRPTTTEVVDLNDATREVLALLRGELQRARVALRLQLAEELPSVNGDRVQLQQVILNLVLNAATAMNAVEGRLRQLLIRSEKRADRVCLQIQDAGVGLQGQDLERLFEAFYTTKSDGMGIGLSVSRAIIENHHGSLWAAHNSGPGATFSFSIPCLPGAPE
ncbi:MAG: PAS domain-containing protein [Polyangiaceae bacterium]